MASSLDALKELFAAYQRVSTSLRDETSSMMSTTYADTLKEFLETKKQKEHDSLKKDLLKLMDKVDKAVDDLQSYRERWYTTGKDLEKALDAEIASREGDLKLIRQDAEAVEKLNEKIRKYNEEKNPKPPLPLEEPIEVSTDPVADVKSFAAEIFFWLKFIEDRKASFAEVKKLNATVRKNIQSHTIK